MTTKVLKYFEEICKIPHCSYHNEKIGEYLLQWGKTNSFVSKQDKVGNVIIYVPATKSKAGLPAVILQGHMDMVCEKNSDSKHDFQKDPITLVNDGIWLNAKETTLGADNGIALAMAMALAEDDNCEHPDLELLFTVDEEVGLDGAKAIDPNWLKGKNLINIDSEDEGVITIGCAGGKDTDIDNSYSLANSEFENIYNLKISGLLGGHSGINIDDNRGNAIIVLAEIISHIVKDYQICEFSGGTAHNAIPRESYVTFSSKEKISVSDFAKIKEEIGARLNINLLVEITEAKANLFISETDSKKLIDMILEIPNGVFSYSKKIDGLIETSDNLAIVKLMHGKLTIKTSQRSAIADDLIKLSDKIEMVAKAYNCNVHTSIGYPSWEPDFDSKLVAKSKRVYKKLFDKEMEVEVIHAGLECGIIGAKIPGLDMISIGPTIQNPHSPQERIHLESIGTTYKFIKSLLDEE